MWIICCWSMDLVPGILFDLMGKPGMDPPIAGLESAGLQSGPGRATGAELVGSILLTFGFCRLQSPPEFGFIDIFLFEPPTNKEHIDYLLLKNTSHALARQIAFCFLYFPTKKRGPHVLGFAASKFQKQPQRSGTLRLEQPGLTTRVKIHKPLLPHVLTWATLDPSHIFFHLLPVKYKLDNQNPAEMKYSTQTCTGYGHYHC